MNEIQDIGVKRINFEIPSGLHRKLKAKFSSENRTFKGVLLPFLAACLEGDGIPRVVSENGSPGAEVDSLDMRINKLLEAKLSGLGVKVKDQLPPLEEHSVEPVVPPLEEHNVEPVEKLAQVEESVVAERAVEAKNGLIATGKKVTLAEKVVAQRRIVGKMIILAEQAKRGYFDWFTDGGSYTVVTAEERDAELAERKKDGLAEEKEVVEDEEAEE